MGIDRTLYEGYIGPNGAHVAYKREIVNAKVLYMQIHSGRDQLKTSFESRVSEARASAGTGPFSIGMVTETLSDTQFRALNIPHNELFLVVQDYASLEAQFQALQYVDLQRILESFLVDLYAEVARKDSRILMCGRTVTFTEVLKTTDLVKLLLEKQLEVLSHSSREDLDKEFEGIGLPIISRQRHARETAEFLTREFHLLWGVRNILQHNHGIVNALFLKNVQTSEYALGDRVRIDIPRLGRAFAVVEVIADDLNQRAVSKFGLS